MSFFTKFKNRILPSKQSHRYERLVHFEKNWIFCRERLLEEPISGETQILDAKLTDSLKLLINLLVQEKVLQEDGTNGECMEYLLRNDILEWLVNLSETDLPFGFRGEVIRTLSSMISTLDEHFLIHNEVYGPTAQLLNCCMKDQNHLEFYHEDIVGLMFSICSKIRRCPELLGIFFSECVWDIENIGQSESSTGKSKHEFPIFGYLLRFVHKEGKTGDIARTAVLFIIEISSGELRDYVHTESDLCAIVAAGVGAFYSLLPRKLVVKLHLEEDEKIVSHHTEPLEIEEAQGVESSTSSEFQDHLSSFIKYIEFTQELLERCPSVRIRNSLLENIRRTFFENILYPSLLECSETDGSAVAVITYVNVLIQIIYQRELSSIFVRYLMNMKPGTTEKSRDSLYHVSPRSEASNTTERADVISIDSGTGLLTSIEHKALSPYNIKEVVINNLKSSSQQIVVTTLNLLHTMLKRHCHHSCELFEVVLVSNYGIHDETIKFTDSEDVDKQHQTHGLKAVDHLRVMDLYFSLISRIDSAHDKGGFVQVYDDYLYDVQQQLEEHQEYHQECALHKNSSKKRKEDTESKGYPLLISKKQPNLYFPRHRLNGTDPILQILLSLLSQFFAHSCEFNLALTRVLSTLATCPYRCTSGWLSFEEYDRCSAKPGDSPGNSIHVVPRSLDDMTESLDTKDPSIVSVFHTLTEHVSYYRSKVPNLDQMLQERRYYFLNQSSEEKLIGIDTTFNKPLDYDEEFDESDLLSPTSADAIPITGSFLRHVDTYNSTTRSTHNKEIPPIQVHNISSLVDNIIILSETMKELTCIIEVRKSLGADYVRYM